MSILDTLSKERIFSVCKVAGGYEFGECCDYHFTHTLTEQQLDDLIAELIALKSRISKGGK